MPFVLFTMNLYVIFIFILIISRPELMYCGVGCQALADLRDCNSLYNRLFY